MEVQHCHQHMDMDAWLQHNQSSRFENEEEFFFLVHFFFFSGVYGTLGSGTTSTTPGAREIAISWTDSNGDLWFFGGFGYASTSSQGECFFHFEKKSKKK